MCCIVMQINRQKAPPANTSKTLKKLSVTTQIYHQDKGLSREKKSILRK